MSYIMGLRKCAGLQPFIGLGATAVVFHCKSEILFNLGRDANT